MLDIRSVSWGLGGTDPKADDPLGSFPGCGEKDPEADDPMGPEADGCRKGTASNVLGGNTACIAAKCDWTTLG